MYKLTKCKSKSVCPICENKEIELLYEVTSEASAEHFIHHTVSKDVDYLQNHIEKLWGQSTCEVVRCTKCRFCYSLPYVEGDKTFYQFLYDEKPKYPWRPEHDLTFRVLENMRDFSILEVASGDGTFIRVISPSLTSLENVLCTEYSKDGRNVICNNYGITCTDTDFRILEGKFDVICMFQILEHLVDVNNVFGRLNLLSHAGTNLFISVPNDKRLEKREQAGGMLDMPPNHIGRWNRKCFDIVAKKYGWSIIKFETPKENCHWIYMKKDER